MRMATCASPPRPGFHVVEQRGIVVKADVDDI